MTMKRDLQPTAREVLEIVPLVMRALRADLLQRPDLPNPGHFRLLHTLVEGPHNLSELAEKHNVTLPTMSNTVTTLCEHGLVLRTQAEDDRRRVVIQLTPAGRALFEKIKTQAENRIAALLEPLSDSEHRQLADGLAVLKRAFSRLPEA